MTRAKSKPTVQEDLERAEELAQQARQLRVQQCSAEIEEVLSRHQCTFRPFFIVDGSQVKSYVNIVPVSANTSMAQRIQGLNSDGKFS